MSTQFWLHLLGRSAILFIIFFVAGGGVLCKKTIIFASEGFGVFAGNVWFAHVRSNDDLTTT